MVEMADVDRQAIEAAVADMLQYLTLQPAGAGTGAWVGESPEWLGDYVFGGCVIAQAIMAGTRDAPAGTRLHSMHAYFLRPVSSKNSVHYQIDDLRAGRSFTARRLQASQDGRAVLDMSCSFTSDTDGYLYDLPAPQRISFPTDLQDEQGPGPWVARFVGPTPPATDGTRQSTHRMWFRIPAELPDDAHLHTALLGFATDWTGVGGRPLHLEGDTQGMISLDHSAWFHRPMRADTWLFYDVQSLVNAGGRGLLRGVIRDPEGRVVISVAQEMRLIPV